MKRFIGRERRQILWRGFAPELQDARFQLFFDSVGEFHSGVREQLHTVVWKWIVRGGDDHAGLKIILPHQTSHPGSGDHPGESHPRASLPETRGEQGGHVRTGFASVQADEDMSRAMFSPEIHAERASRGVERGVVQRRRARYAANPVGSKKLFAHFEEPCLPTVRSIVQPTSLPTTSAKLNIGKTMTYGPLQPMPHLLLRTILRIGATSLPDLLDRHAGLGHRKQFRRMC